jgi:2-dehydro-3-deoxygluconokinase
MWSKEKAKEKLLQWLEDTDILLAGVEELEIMFGTNDIDVLLDKLKAYDVEHIFIKQGAEGALHSFKGEVHSEPAQKTTAVDTVGAGDGFNAGAVYGLLNGWESEKILKFANTIGSMVVEVYGDNEGLPYLEEVEAKLNNSHIIDR